MSDTPEIEDTTSGTDDRVIDLGHFVQPFFQIHLNGEWNESDVKPKTLANLSDTLDKMGVLPTFIHELVHFFQFAGTLDGISLMETFCSLYDCYSAILNLSRKIGVVPASFRPPLIEWLKIQYFADASHAEEARDIDALFAYILDRLTRRRGSFIRELNYELPCGIREHVYPIKHHRLVVNATWSEYLDCEVTWSIAKDCTYVLSAGSDVVREGMARAIETYFKCSFDSNLARQTVLKDTFAAERRATDFDRFMYFFNYYWLFRTFAHIAGERKVTKHLTVETFVAVCELALCFAGANSSTARLAIMLFQKLFDNANAIPVLKLDDQRPFFNAMCKAADLDIDDYHQATSKWVAEWPERVTARGFGSLIFKERLAFGQLHKLREASRSAPFLSLRFLSEDALGSFIIDHMTGIIVTVNNATFPLFRDEKKIPEYLNLLALQDFMLQSLFAPGDYQCVLFRERRRRVCGWLEEGNECDSTWPKARCDYDHPCAFMEFLGQRWKATFS
jgi:hypothetical protein